VFIVLAIAASIMFLLSFIVRKYDFPRLAAAWLSVSEAI
jgi:hypothetical protein